MNRLHPRRIALSENAFGQPSGWEKAELPPSARLARLSRAQAGVGEDAEGA